MGVKVSTKILLQGTQKGLHSDLVKQLKNLNHLLFVEIIWCLIPHEKSERGV